MIKTIHFTSTYWLRNLCLAAFMLVTTIIQADELCTLGSSIDPIELPGKEFPDITGVEISQIRVFAYHDGQAIVIPFQIDQKNSRGEWVWDGLLLEEGEEQDDAIINDDADPPGHAIFDENDLIVFVAHDAGERSETHAKALGADSTAEVEIADPLTGGKCWVYVASYHSSEPPELSDIQYVRYLPEEHRVIGQEYEFRYSIEHNAVIDDLVIGGFSTFDRNKMRGTITAGIGFLNTDIEFNEESIQGYDVGYINGPVRVIKRSVNYVRTKSGMESPGVNCDHFYYPWHSEVPMLIDGTKIKANASKHKAMSWGYANKLEEQLRREVQELLRRAERADAEDEPEIDIPDELARREDRLAAIKKAKAEIERRAQERFEAEQAEYEAKLKQRKDKESETGKKARGREPKPPEAGPRDKDQVNFTDDESRIMPSSDGFVQAYNAQAGVDIDSHLVVENHITQQSNDKQEVESTLKGLKGAEAQLGKADGLLADAGYFSADNVKQCEAAKIVPYISDHRERHNRTWDERFKTPPPCPQDADAVTAMAYRLRTTEGKAIYARRKSTVETVFGIIKEVMGFRRFHLRGLNAAQGEWNLVCMAWNLKRMYVLGG